MKLLIIDNYDSFTYNLYQDIGELLDTAGRPFQLIVKRNDEITRQEVEKEKFDSIIISPGPGNPADKKYFGVCAEILTEIGKKIPVLGVCLGMQGMAHYFGGKVVPAKRMMHGKTSLIHHDGKGIFRGLPQNLEVMRYHSLIADVRNIPNCLEISATVEDTGEIMGLRHKRYPIEGVQFHPESFATEGGKIILKNFLFETYSSSDKTFCGDAKIVLAQQVRNTSSSLNESLPPKSGHNSNPHTTQTFSAPLPRRQAGQKAYSSLEKFIKLMFEKLLEQRDLTLAEARDLMEQILDGKLTHAQLSAILTALRMKGESEEEILGFIQVMRKYMEKISVGGVVIDTCGTGGDGSGTFNISTAAALVVAGAGVAVAKHGNRSASSRSGSADVLEALGININMVSQQAEECLKRVGITFLFAPLYHPAMKHMSHVRKGLGIRTVFNFLGPFVSPAGVKRQIIGVPNSILAEKLARVALRLNYERILIVASHDGLDEISISDKTHVFEITNKRLKKMIIDPGYFGIKRAAMQHIQGGDAKRNAGIIQNILNGEDGPRRDIVVINAAAALYVAGKVKSLNEGKRLAEITIDTGKAKEILEKFRDYSQRYDK